MTASVLVATPHQAFGELLRLSLAEEGRYRVRLVHSAREAADTLADSVFDIAILDGEMKDMRVSELGRQMLSHIPGLKVVLIPPDNDPKHPSLAGMVYHGYILRPFYLPDLLDMMESLSEEKPQTPSTAVEESGAPHAPPPVPLSPELFEQALASTGALAGVVLVGKEQSLTRGDLPNEVAAELETLVDRALSSGERTDLVRFVRLPGQMTDHLFYITPVAENMALGLAYPVGTPLSRVRTQASQVAEVLRPPPKAPAADAVRAAVRSWADAAVSAPAPAPAEQEPEEEEGEDLRDINLAALLGSVPPPNPGEPAQTGWVPEISMSLPRSESETLFPWDQASIPPAGDPLAPSQSGTDAEATRPVPVAARFPAEPARKPEDTRPVTVSADAPLPRTAAPQPVSQPIPKPLPQSVPQPAAAFEPTGAPARTPTSPPRAPQAALPEEEPPVHELEDTRPRVLTSLTNFQQLVPASPGYSLLSYTCVLIPRLPQHHLTGGLGAQTGQWVQQLCLAFGWRLEGIAIRPEYLQWTVQVSPSIAPANLIRILRARISGMIFENYPVLAKQNPSGDFWATGYLIVSGMQPPSPLLLREYLAETRRRQGLNYPGGEPLVQADSAPSGLPEISPAPSHAY